MAVIEGAAEFGVTVQIDVRVAEWQQPVHLEFGAASSDVLAMIRIGHVGGGRREKGDLRPIAAQMRCTGDLRR